MHWRDVEEIAAELENNFHDEEIPENDLPYLEEMVLSLHNFEDREVEVEKYTLKKIIENWIEIRNS